MLGTAFEQSKETDQSLRSPLKSLGDIASFQTFKTWTRGQILLFERLLKESNRMIDLLRTDNKVLRSEMKDVE